MIRLFTTAYKEKDERRRNELARCLRYNRENKQLLGVYILNEGGAVQADSKVIFRNCDERPTFQQYFQWIEELAADADISIVANSDIYFDTQLEIFKYWNLPSDMVLVLSRWDLRADGSAKLYDHNDSQDAWILKGKPRPLRADFPVGVPRCDNRIAAEFEQAGYRVTNPAFSLRCFHLHDGPSRYYVSASHTDSISPPYKYIWPHNHFDPFRTLIHNFRHPSCRLLWRFDRRKFERMVPIRLVKRLTRLFAA